MFVRAVAVIYIGARTQVLGLLSINFQRKGLGDKIENVDAFNTFVCSFSALWWSG